MKVSGPRDLPDFRMWLIDQWKPAGIFAKSAVLMAAMGIDRVVDGVPVVNTDPNTETYALPRAALWWVTEDMTDLVAHAAPTMPETTLTDDLIPDRFGLVVFAKPLMGVMADTGEPISTDAMVWCRGVNLGREAINITSYHYSRAGEDIGNSRMGHVIADKDMWSPTGAAGWELGTDTETVDAPKLPSYDHRDESFSEDRRWLATLWLLATQPLTDSTIERAPRAAARRHDRAKLPASSDVRLINVRRRSADKTDGNPDGSGREYSHRWIVGGEQGGFWRQQAYGPAWSLRRPQWIDAYIAGPADKPLKISETVNVVKGETR